MSDEKTLEIILDFFNAQEAACVNAKRQISELLNVTEKSPQTVSEQTFTILKFEPQQGKKIGEYDVAYKASNVEENWNHAFNILRQNNASINARYHGKGYVFSYWLYGENKIYRQKLKTQV